MAKAKFTGADDFESAVTEPAPPAAVVDPRDAEIARLKAELESAKAPDLQASEPVPQSGNKQKYLVEVLHGPRWVVEAQHEAHASTEYLKATGMVSWVSMPTVREVGDDVPLGEYKG